LLFSPSVLLLIFSSFSGAAQGHTTSFSPCFGSLLVSVSAPDSGPVVRQGIHSRSGFLAWPLCAPFVGSGFSSSCGRRWPWLCWFFVRCENSSSRLIRSILFVIFAVCFCESSFPVSFLSYWIKSSSFFSSNCSHTVVFLTRSQCVR
jgi:hypothetical protein